MWVGVHCHAFCGCLSGKQVLPHVCIALLLDAHIDMRHAALLACTALGYKLQA